MKKLIAILLLVCLMPLCALAEMDADGDVVVTLPGMEFFFTPIRDGYLLTRESSASVFNRLGMSQREMLPFMEEYGVYALMYDADLTCEVQIVAYETVETDFDELTEYGENMLCRDMAAYYADEGYDVQDVSMYYAADGHKFVRSTVSYTYEDGYVEPMVEYLTCQAGYTVQIVLFPYEGETTAAHIALADAVADSMWIKPVGNEAELSLEGIRIRMMLPDGVTLLTGKDDVNAWDGLPEEYARLRRSQMSLNHLHGVIAAPDNASWDIQWSLLKGDGGTLDYLSDEAAQRHCQDQMDTLEEEGNTVTGGRTCWMGAHRYTNVTYSYTNEYSTQVYAEEYYTRQDGWNVVVCLHGYGSPAPEEAHTLLEAIVASQRITVE